MIIDRYISTEVIRPFCGGLGLLVLIFVGYTATIQLNLAAQGQLGIGSALKLILLNTLVTLEVLMPSALFFSVLAAISRLYRDSEMNAFFAAGVSHHRILESVFKLSVLVALITGFISIEGRPWAYREVYRLEAEALAEFDLKKMATGEFVSLGSSDFIFIAEDIDLAKGLHKDVFLHKHHRKQKRTEIIVAEEASLPALNPGESLTAEFLNGYHYFLDRRKSQDITMRFKRLTIQLQNNEAHSTYRRKAETTGALGISAEPKDIAEFQWRLSTPLATILLAMLAVPLGKSEPRESRFRSFFIAIAVYVGVFSLTSVTRTFIEQGRIPPFPGLWLAYAGIAVVLLLLIRQPRLQPK
ncbi:MAG: LPS export ABC transporter permease LptF [Gammaproteobacteria bacterium]|nr:LPS export ABC transporter permease LptF [Gammaproteobacteria bacterium]